MGVIGGVIGRSEESGQRLAALSTPLIPVDMTRSWYEFAEVVDTNRLLKYAIHGV